MKKNKKIITNNPVLKPDEVISREDRLKLSQMIIGLTESLSQAELSDYVLDRESERIQLLSGEYTSMHERRKSLKVIASMKREYAKRFPQEYFDQIFRLHGWPLADNKSHRPSIIGRYTNEIIYGRFDRDILPTLQILNPYIEFGIRKYKHFQWLNDEGLEKLDQYIREAISAMKDSDDWYKFRLSYATKFNLNWQLKMDL